MADTTSYPKGKTGRLPMGSRSNHIPGDGKNITDRKGGTTRHPRSAADCADDMSTIVPGANIGKGTVFNK